MVVGSQECSRPEALPWLQAEASEAAWPSELASWASHPPQCRLHAPHSVRALAVTPPGCLRGRGQR